jgi:hypothetical protein
LWHAWGRRDIRTGFWKEKIKGKRPFSIPKHGKEDNIKINLKQDGRAGIILIS